ncbi:hypothetical protein A2690_00645 [Candidatus Roizmanbacteria bacterium RIFCSPHIGHO2_01_FULL_39_12b]|uniref:Uncharacterized protein n=1 Tax=Candidatus Roizmanbacteria bacterium RIFCSPHIGHO2_01_FULL_39_12b TaxID=1802030 RepID=A0A1F7GAL9_9BACT|nr:MAG: hypothetical protein A2690_00645 [Candidatus Roizmanbacteria bacterium RIFCSPHIGHO2_01_FULL_39_12b]
MDNSLNGSGVETGTMPKISTNVVLYVAAGVFLLVALLAGLYLTSQTQNVGKKAQTPDSCQGDDKIIAGECPSGYVPIGTVGGRTQDGSGAGGDTQVISGKTQLCCQRQEQPTSIPPTSALPTDVPPTQSEPTKSEVPTEVPPTSVPPTETPSCKQAPQFSVDIIINNCPGCLGGSQQ